MAKKSQNGEEAGQPGKCRLHRRQENFKPVATQHEWCHSIPQRNKGEKTGKRPVNIINGSY